MSSRDYITEALATLSRVQERSKSSDLREDAALYAHCLRVAIPDERTAADLLRGIAALVERHPNGLASEMKRLAEEPKRRRTG